MRQADRRERAKAILGKIPEERTERPPERKDDDDVLGGLEFSYTHGLCKTHMLLHSVTGYGVTFSR